MTGFTRWPVCLSVAGALLSAPIASVREPPNPLDVLLVGGQVIDPESGLDAIRNVGVRDGKIATISTSRPPAREVLDVSGMVVAPGFIDIHTHGQDSVAYGYYARDGVTTALELEIGTYPVSPWYAAREGSALVNFGIAAGHSGVRIAEVERDSSREAVEVVYYAGPWAREVLPPSRVARIAARLDAGLREGGLGIGLGLGYSPGSTREEILEVFRVAARHRVPVFAHMRGQGNLDDGGAVDGLQELLANVAVTGASLHVMHTPSMGLGRTPVLLRMLQESRAHGLDVTTEAYPYPAAQTPLQGALFDPGWEQRMGIGYADLLWPRTGERLTEESFKRYRQAGGNVVFFAIPDSAIEAVYRDSSTIIASDAGAAVVGHPRRAGTHARVLARYVREKNILSLTEAIRKMTLLPARRLESFAPQMRNKGRLKPGADADITVFDPQSVQDRATFEEPNQYSTGIPHVMVGGTFIVRDSRFVPGVRPGKPVRAAQNRR